MSNSLSLAVSNLTPQRGIALITALLFLTIITLLGITSVHLSTLELKMAHNDQLRISALETAQAAIDASLDESGNIVLSDRPDSLYRCFSSTPQDGCDSSDIALPYDLFSKGILAEVTRVEPLEHPVYALLATSSDKFALAAFVVRGRYDQSAEGFGAADIEQGYTELLPKDTRIED